MKMHPRIVPMRRAKSDINDAIDETVKKNNLEVAEVIELLAQIVADTARCCQKNYEEEDDE